MANDPLAVPRGLTHPKPHKGNPLGVGKIHPVEIQGVTGEIPTPAGTTRLYDAICELDSGPAAELAYLRLRKYHAVFRTPSVSPDPDAATDADIEALFDALLILRATTPAGLIGEAGAKRSASHI